MYAAIYCKEPKKISHPEWFAFGLTHFAPKNALSLLLIVSTSLRLGLFGSISATKFQNSQFFSAYLVCILRLTGYAPAFKFGLQGVEL